MNHKNIGIIGLGFWGTALAQYLKSIGHEVLAWDYNNEVVNSISNKKINPNCYSDHILNFSVTADLSKVLEKEVIILAIKCQAIPEIPQLLTLTNKTILISAMKGFEPKTGSTPVAYLKSKGCKARCGAISGPSFSHDVMIGTPVAITAAADNIDLATEISNIFSSEKMRLYPTSDLIGAELGGALKNIIALAVGVAEGLKLSASTKAALITRGLAEMTRYAVSCGALQSTLAGLSGIGDLVLTANSTLSRNYSFGILIGQGIKAEDALRAVGSTAEGYYSAIIINSLAKSKTVSMPITSTLVSLFNNEKNPKEVIKELMTRPIKAE
jgi:glycerol-3-phosphate dehydrogenase (NAD(P)+)